MLSNQQSLLFSIPSSLDSPRESKLYPQLKLSSLLEHKQDVKSLIQSRKKSIIELSEILDKCYDLLVNNHYSSSLEEIETLKKIVNNSLIKKIVGTHCFDDFLNNTNIPKIKKFHEILQKKYQDYFRYNDVKLAIAAILGITLAGAAVGAGAAACVGAITSSCCSATAACTFCGPQTDIISSAVSTSSLLCIASTCIILPDYFKERAERLQVAYIIQKLEMTILITAKGLEGSNPGIEHYIQIVDQRIMEIKAEILFIENFLSGKLFENFPEKELPPEAQRMIDHPPTRDIGLFAPIPPPQEMSTIPLLSEEKRLFNR